MTALPTAVIAERLLASRSCRSIFSIADVQRSGAGRRLRQAIQKSECEIRALAKLTGHLDFASVQFDEFTRERETQARALGFGIRLQADLAKFFEHRRAVFRGDADAGVGDADLDAAGNRIRCNGNPPAVWRELHRVR